MDRSGAARSAGAALHRSGHVPDGRERLRQVDETLSGARRLANAFETVERGRPRACVFFRAEDSFGFTKRIECEMREIDADAMLSDPRASPFRRRLGANITRGSRGMLAAKYGDDRHARSHGETFLGIVRAQLLPSALYFLDEPETPLSPIRNAPGRCLRYLESDSPS